MKYRVEWYPIALDDLARIWTAADSNHRREITVAARDVDRLLRTDPETQGESRDAGRRSAFVGPLVLTVRVVSEDQVVRVLRVVRP